MRLKIYRRGGLIPLSEAVPVLENFGFRVLAEIPIELEGEAKAHIHDCLLELADGTLDRRGHGPRRRSSSRRSPTSSAARAENDAFNQLVLYAGLDPRPVVWLRAWFRYMRQTGVAFSLATVVDALRRAPKATDALIELFAVAHDPKAVERPRRGRQGGGDSNSTTR